MCFLSLNIPKVSFNASCGLGFHEIGERVHRMGVRDNKKKKLRNTGGGNTYGKLQVASIRV